jgi:hypothetical protein
MVLDPIFQGLAVALMSGAVVATLLTMIVVPLLYWELRRRQSAPNQETINAPIDGDLQRPEPAAGGVAA